MNAAVRGAQSVLCVDASAAALDHVQKSAQRNGVAELVSVQRGDAFEVLAELVREGRKFESIALDPPALIKRQKDHSAGFQAYQRLNEQALKYWLWRCSFHRFLLDASQRSRARFGSPKRLCSCEGFCAHDWAKPTSHRPSLLASHARNAVFKSFVGSERGR